MDDEDSTTSLTDEECKALLTALNRGYFSGSRQETLAALADELDTSETEAFRRLRCAMADVFEEHRELFEQRLDEDEYPPLEW